MVLFDCNYLMSHIFPNVVIADRCQTLWFTPHQQRKKKCLNVHSHQEGPLFALFGPDQNLMYSLLFNFLFTFLQESQDWTTNPHACKDCLIIGQNQKRRGNMVKVNGKCSPSVLHWPCSSELFYKNQRTMRGFWRDIDFITICLPFYNIEHLYSPFHTSTVLLMCWWVLWFVLIPAEKVPTQCRLEQLPTQV